MNKIISFEETKFMTNISTDPKRMKTKYGQILRTDNFKYLREVAQVVRRSPPTAALGVPSLCLGHSIWVSWCVKQILGTFFSGFLPFPQSQISFHHLIHFIASVPVMVRQACSADTLRIHIPSPKGLHRISAFHPSTRPNVGHKGLRIFEEVSEQNVSRKNKPLNLDLTR